MAVQECAMQSLLRDAGKEVDGIAHVEGLHCQKAKHILQENSHERSE